MLDVDIPTIADLKSLISHRDHIRARLSPSCRPCKTAPGPVPTKPNSFLRVGCLEQYGRSTFKKTR
jgi:hypothetical protein